MAHGDDRLSHLEVEEFARLVGYSPKYVYRLIATGKVSATRKKGGGQLFVPRTEIVAMQVRRQRAKGRGRPKNQKISDEQRYAPTRPDYLDREARKKLGHDLHPFDPTSLGGRGAFVRACTEAERLLPRFAARAPLLERDIRSQVSGPCSAVSVFREAVIESCSFLGLGYGSPEDSFGMVELRARLRSWVIGDVKRARMLELRRDPDEPARFVQEILDALGSRTTASSSNHQDGARRRGGRDPKRG